MLLDSKPNSQHRQTLKKAVLDTLPVLAGYLVLGIGFGMILKSKGYGVWWSLAMSFFIYAGSMQYVAVDLLAGGASLISVGLTTLMVNARHLFYGISMVEKYKHTGKKKPYLIFALSDETYSLVSANGEKGDPHMYFFFVSLFNQIYWIVGSMIGSFIPFEIKGIDFALTALFITVFVDQWLHTEDHVPAVIGVAVSVICLAVFGSAHFLIPAMIFITVALAVLKKVRKEDKCNG